MYRFQLALKRVFDVVVCLIVIILGLPFFGFIALLVRLSSSGPIFFVQERVGMNKKNFRIIKFRTMIDSPLEEPVTVWTESEEARITPVGKFLRDYGIDELPQVVNILKGEMSIVGPRAPLPNQVENYTKVQCKVFQMRPGVLSLAAVEGRRSIPMEKRIDLHVRYMEKWSLMLDLKILLYAFFIVLLRKDATEVIND